MPGAESTAAVEDALQPADLGVKLRDTLQEEAGRCTSSARARYTDRISAGIVSHGRRCRSCGIPTPCRPSPAPRIASRPACSDPSISSRRPLVARYAIDLVRDDADLVVRVEVGALYHIDGPVEDCRRSDRVP